VIFALEIGYARLLHIVLCGKTTLTGITSCPSVLGAKGRCPFTALATPQPPKRALERHAYRLATFVWHLALAFWASPGAVSNVHGPPCSGTAEVSAKRQLAFSTRSSHNTIGQPHRISIRHTLTATRIDCVLHSQVEVLGSGSATRKASSVREAAPESGDRQPAVTRELALE
jgi:hypothetical protein